MHHETHATTGSHAHAARFTHLPTTSCGVCPQQQRCSVILRSPTRVVQGSVAIRVGPTSCFNACYLHDMSCVTSCKRVRVVPYTRGGASRRTSSTTPIADRLPLLDARCMTVVQLPLHSGTTKPASPIPAMLTAHASYCLAATLCAEQVKPEGSAARTPSLPIGTHSKRKPTAS